MYKTHLIILIFFIIGCVDTNHQRNRTLSKKGDEWLWEWVNSWDKLSKETFNLKDSSPPEMLFFDKSYVYSNSIIATPDGINFNGPDLYNQKITWRKQKHNDTLILPDGTRAQVRLMTFAAPSENGNYFVMPAPGYWQDLDLSNKIVSLKQMLNGIFIHEFAHTRQMDGIVDKIVEFEKNGKYKYPVNDDILQNYFQSDSTYILNFKQEVDELYELLDIQEQSELRLKAKQWLTKFRHRQKEYLDPVSINLTEMDNVFLTMEGIGQYAMMKYYMSDNGGRYSFEDALKATRHTKKWWSQEEGLGLILLYEKLVNKIDWLKLYTLNSTTIIDLIEREI